MTFNPKRASAACLAMLGFIVSCASQSGAKDLLGWIAGETIAEAEAKLKRDVDATLGSFLSETDRISTQFLNKGTNSGSLLTIQAANQMAVLSETARTQFGDELGKELGCVSTK